MRGPRLLALVLAPVPALVALALLAACSSSSAQPDAGLDASSGPQPVGAPCDPSIAVPCIPTRDACLGVACDPRSRVCAAFVTDAGPPCTGSAAKCTTSADCDLGLACGFAIGGGGGGGGDGCGVQGKCIDVPVLCQNDAGGCSSAGSACGCDGATVSLVVPGYASAPATGPGPCPDAGGGALDAGKAAADAGDGGDGGT